MFSAADIMYLMYLRHFSNPTDSRVLTVAVDPSRSVAVGPQSRVAESRVLAEAQHLSWATGGGLEN